VERPQRASARTNDVDARKDRRRLGWPGGSLVTAEELFAVASAEQEGKALQVVTQLADVVGGVADELFQQRAEATGITREPVRQELQHLGEFGCIGGIQGHLGHGFTAFRGWVAWALQRSISRLVVRGTAPAVSPSMTSRKLLFSVMTVTILPAWAMPTWMR
jgi:hypothetical protein